MQELFLQVGAARDGRDGYLAAARRRGMRAVLVETPEYNELRRRLGRAQFDRVLSVETPADATVVAELVVQEVGVPQLVLAGFERYAECAHALGAGFRSSSSRPSFRPPAKFEQRDALRCQAPDVAQPTFQAIPEAITSEWLATLSYPVVVKPVDGGGGLGVLRADTPGQLVAAIRHIGSLRNYDNARFRGLLVESYIEGPEWSVQGLMCAGRACVLACCEKAIASQPDPQSTLCGFREVAHLAFDPAQVPSSIRDLAARCALATGYRDGPFHIDLRMVDAMPVFIEMGFRLSGGAVTDLVRDVSGYDWAEVSFGWMHGDSEAPRPRGSAGGAAHMLAWSAGQVDAARRLDERVAVWVEPILPAHTVVSDEHAVSLAADLSRHAGPVARIHFRGADPNEVRAAVTQLLNTDTLGEEIRR